MNSKRLTVCGLSSLFVLAGLLVLLTQAPVFAGLSTRSQDGDYRGTNLTGTRTQLEPHLWTELVRDPDDVSILNPGGDANGDLWPVIMESNKAPYHPWVLWSHFTGAGYDLAWSRWIGKGWSPIRLVESNASVHDDLDPDLTFSHSGLPFITWWRDEGGIGRVFISVFLNGKWVTPSQVSMSKIDSRYPTIRIRPSGRIYVEYMTPNGLVRQSIVFTDSTGITEDIDPYFHLEGEAVVVGQPTDEQ